MQQPATQEHDPAPSRRGPGKPAPQRAPIELELGDGSRLVLDSAEASPIVCRIEGMHDRICLEDALQLNGQPFAGFRLLR